MLTIAIFERGAVGTPSTTFVTNLADRISSYEDTVNATGWYESMRCTLTASEDEAMDFLTSWLMRSVIVYSPDAVILWEGFLEGVEVTFGQERRSVSLDLMANRVRVRYTTVNGVAGTTSTTSDTTSQALYGIKDGVVTLSTTTSAIAANLAAVELARRKNPTMTPSTEVGGAAAATIEVSLQFRGWYAALDWVMLSSTSTTLTSNTTQAGTLITTYNATNNFYNSSTEDITSLGVSVSETVTPDTTCLQRMEALLCVGTGADRFAWGFAEGRQFFVRTWAGAAPTTVSYQRGLGESRVFDQYGSEIPLWEVTPDAMVQVVELLDAAPVTTAADAAGRYYVERVTRSIDKDGARLTLEPQATDSVDALLARLA